MAVAPWRRQVEPPRQRQDEGGLRGELESCSAQLRGLCGDQTVDEEAHEADDDAHSAVDIASECMALLEIIRFDDNGDASHVTETKQCTAAQDEAPTETELLCEFNALGDELQALMTALCGEQHTAETGAATPPASCEPPSPALDVCTSPKMKALTRRLSSRPTSHLMERQNARSRHAFSTRLKLLSDTLRSKTPAKSSPTRQLMSDAAFWKQHQSKSFRQHIARQSQARQQEEEAKEKLTKAVEYRYRRVPKPCYPLALKSRGVDVESPAAKINLPVVHSSTQKHRQSYALRFGTSQVSTNAPSKSDTAEERGLLCGVYLHGKRRKGTLYLTCSSMTQLKTTTKQRFKLPEDATIVNLYREQVNKGGRKYLHRIESFHELRNGDLLCATTDSYQDMAILCSWMKQRQRTMPPSKKPVEAQAKTVEARVGEPAVTQTGSKKKQDTTPSDSLAFQPPPPAPIKLWDHNGRLVNIDQRLPL